LLAHLIGRACGVALAGGAAGDTGAGPVVFFGSPTDGAVYFQCQVLAAGYVCGPGASGYPAVSCVGDVPLGGNVDTSTVHAATVRFGK
jgi:hypothetical protein